MTAEYSCPHCESDVTLVEHTSEGRCPECGGRFIVDYDAEFVDGGWRDLTTMRPDTRKPQGP